MYYYILQLFLQLQSNKFLKDITEGFRMAPAYAAVKTVQRAVTETLLDKEIFFRLLSPKLLIINITEGIGLM